MKSEARLKRKEFDWKKRTGNLGETYYQRHLPRHAETHMAHKPYGHYYETVDKTEPERESLEW